MILDVLLTGRTIAYNVKLAKIAGSVNAGLLLYQLCFWSDKGFKYNFFYKTIEEIEEEIGFSRREQDGAIKLLKERNFIKVVVRGVPPKRFFSVNFEEIQNALFNLKSSISSEQIDLSKKDKFIYRYDFREDSENREEREGFFDEKLVEEFISYLLKTEKVRNPIAYKSLIRSKIEKRDKVTLDNFNQFLALYMPKQQLNRFEEIFNSREFVFNDRLYEFIRLGFRDDFQELYNSPDISINSIILSCWRDFNYDKSVFLPFPDFNALEKFTKEVLI